ncbi:LamG domain-containing protein [Methylobacterium terricola]|uniref:LamG domain-containing protein n=1 Tax=Methylobacterium terricola TaxID=2583531 RepID=A0A5C4LG90_9HYPH|nr:LamG-like jellyroll fold domain-containing protein [Methylobacterium terricola]TNC10838.1 LamG domain-containing protein [Methylobacterium terricola]
MPKKYASSNLTPAFPAWVTSTLPDASGASNYSQTISASSPANAPITYSLVSGSLPAGLSLSGSTIAGGVTNPAADTTYTFTLRATTGQYSSDRTFTIFVTRVTQTDSLSDKVQYLYHLDGNYADTSANARNLTATNPNANGGAQVTTAKYGTGSLYFNGASMSTTTDIRVPASASPLVTGDFTFEFWLNSFSAANGQGNNMVLFCTAVGAAGTNLSTDATNCISIYAQPGYTSAPNRLTVKFQNAGTPFAGSTVVNDGVWRHIAVVRNGMGTSNCAIYVNGVAEAFTTYTGTVDFGATYGLKVGQWVGQQTSCFFKGYIDEVRLTLAPRYTANFTPPAAAFSYP